MLDNPTRSLHKVNPLEFPRDPAPSRYACRVYRVGDTEPFFTMVGQPEHLARWSAKRAVIADYFQCEPGDVEAPELGWTGANGDDMLEVMMIGGRIVGSFNRPISAADVEAIVALADGSRRATEIV